MFSPSNGKNSTPGHMHCNHIMKSRTLCRFSLRAIENTRHIGIHTPVSFFPFLSFIFIFVFIFFYSCVRLLNTFYGKVLGDSLHRRRKAG